MLRTLSRVALLLTVLAVCAPPAMAEVKVKASCREKNRGAGICWWCAAETGCRALGIREGYGLCVKHAEYKGGANVFMVENELTDLGVSVDARWLTTLDWVKKHTDAGHPVCVSCWVWSYLRNHAILVTDVKDGWVYFVDSNHPEDLWRWEEEQFEQAWAHNGCAILPE